MRVLPKVFLKGSITKHVKRCIAEVSFKMNHHLCDRSFYLNIVCIDTSLTEVAQNRRDNTMPGTSSLQNVNKECQNTREKFFLKYIFLLSDIILSQTCKL